MLKAFVQSGKTIPDTFNFPTPEPKSAILPSSFFKDPQSIFYKINQEEEDQRSVLSTPNVDKLKEFLEKFPSEKSTDRDSSQSISYKINREEEQEDEEAEPYGVRVLNKLRLLAGCSPDNQSTAVKRYPLQFIKDLHKIIKYLVYGKNMKISLEYKKFLRFHGKFLVNFINEKNCIKKKKALLWQIQGGFLSYLIQILDEVVGPAIPKLLHTSVVGDYPSNYVYHPSNYVYDTSDEEEGEDEEQEEEAEEDEMDEASDEEAEEEVSNEEEGQESDCGEFEVRHPLQKKMKLESASLPADVRDPLQKKQAIYEEFLKKYYLEDY
jgi:hypothetical protein